VNLTRLLPQPPLTIDTTADDAAARLEELYPSEATWLRINMIASLNGSAVGVDGTSNTLTSRVDRRILGAIRRQSDIVLVGATSIRNEGYLMPRTAALAVVTASGDLEGNRIPGDLEPGRLIVVCPSHAAARVRKHLPGSVDIVETGDARPDAAGIVNALRDRGYRRIVCEGGPNLAAQLLDAGLADELCLSTSPQTVPSVLPVLPGRLQHWFALTQLLVDEDGALYARWQVTR
jgi:riboflavin biosynthesis pyrimidine reductase